jgi:mannitol repressor
MARNRGKVKPSLRDYSHLRLSGEEKTTLIHTVGNIDQHAIVTAILGCVLVEHELERLLRRRFKRNDDAAWKLVVGDRGPLGTFYAMITAGFAFGIYDDKTRDDLHTIRNVRNAFAHSKKNLDFGDPLIIAELRKAHIIGIKMRKVLEGSPGIYNSKGAYIILCVRIYSKLFGRLARTEKVAAKRWREKIMRYLAGQSAALPRPPPGGIRNALAEFLESQRQQNPDYQSDSPIREAHPSSPPEPLRSEEEPGDKKDN